MKDNNGKIILSLLAGATAGAIAGLLLAPETGEGTRASLKRSATKLGDDLNQLFKKGVSRLGEMKANGEQSASAEQASADDVLQSLTTPAKPKRASSKRKTAASTDSAADQPDENLPDSFDGSDSDYDGDSDGRHTGNPSFGQTL